VDKPLRPSPPLKQAIHDDRRLSLCSVADRFLFDPVQGRIVSRCARWWMIHQNERLKCSIQH
jgi:hypothetical protein